MWECNAGPHYDDLQRLFETFWVPDMTSPEQILLQFDLTIIPDPVLAKYMVEAFYEKEAKVEKKKAYYAKLMKQPWGVVETFPPKERYEYERIKALSARRSGARKFPPLAACGTDAYNRLKNHGQVEFCSQGVEDFALYVPDKIIPSKRVLLLRYKNRFDTLVQSLVMRGVNVTSAYPVTWTRKEWSPQEERMAKEVDVLYLHENHAVLEWRDRLGTKDVVAACHDEGVAQLAKSVGFKDVFYAKKSDTEGLTKCVVRAVEHAKSIETVTATRTS
jgi:uroporphyrinogen-III synthase